MSLLAVIKTGGKQYVVTPGKKIQIEKISKKEGDEVVFSDVLLFEGEEGIQIGTPLLEGIQVKGKITKHGKGKKIIAFMYESKKRAKRKKGHRQTFSEVEIIGIEKK